MREHVLGLSSLLAVVESLTGLGPTEQASFSTMLDSTRPHDSGRPSRPSSPCTSSVISLSLTQHISLSVAIVKADSEAGGERALESRCFR